MLDKDDCDSITRLLDENTDLRLENAELTKQSRETSNKYMELLDENVVLRIKNKKLESQIKSFKKVIEGLQEECLTKSLKRGDKR